MPGADADHHVMRLMVELIEEMHVIGSDDFEVHFLRELEQGRGDEPLGVETVIVDFHVGICLTVDLHQLDEGLAGFFLVACSQPFVYRPGNTAGEAD